MGFEPHLTVYEASLWVLCPFIASLRSAEVEAYFHLVIHRPFYLAYASIIVYSTVSISLIPMYGIIESQRKRKEKVRKMEKPVQITLCKGRGCCPVVTISEKGAKITDDNGGEVSISNIELSILKEKLNELDSL